MNSLKAEKTKQLNSQSHNEPAIKSDAILLIILVQ